MTKRDVGILALLFLNFTLVIDVRLNNVLWYIELIGLVYAIVEAVLIVKRIIKKKKEHRLQGFEK